MEDAETLVIASSPELFENEPSITTGQQIILVNSLPRIGASFESILSEYGNNMGGEPQTPVMLEVGGIPPDVSPLKIRAWSALLSLLII
ncbi:MAG: hypothetical protein H6672_21960 [Anaerolineaceae bacterium]|nr:hypothetical protein [Anaerolineaceae bacterium]